FISSASDLSRDIDGIRNGLGFGFKWNMGWMNDTLSYFSKDPVYRKYHHSSLTFSLMYAFSENYILPLSHDEVVHGKKSLIEKMPGDLWQKFANLRLLLFLQWCHPGKKLLFMGGEFGQFSEWCCKRSLDWHLFDQSDYHGKLMFFVSRLNTILHANPALWEQDSKQDGFQWLDFSDRENSIISFARFSNNYQDHLVCLLNFTPQTLYDYPVGLPIPCDYRELLNSDDIAFGGSGKIADKVHRCIHQHFGQNLQHTRITVPPLAGVLLKPQL
ncbi:unnamed protein product, partial [Cyprideis torosa]